MTRLAMIHTVGTLAPVFGKLADETRALLAGYGNDAAERSFTLLDAVGLHMAAQTAAAMGASAKATYTRGYPATVNDAEMAELVREAAREVMGEENVKDRPPAMGAEDFSYFLLEKPGCFFNVGCRNEERGITWGHHHPKFDLDEDSMQYGTATMAQVVLDYLNADTLPTAGESNG